MDQIDALLNPLDAEARVRTVTQSVIGARAPFASPIGRTRSVIYCDYFASGRPLKFIEDTIRDHVLPFYANTHTTTTVTARRTMAQRERSRNVIRECLNADKKLYSVIFTGSGSTAAIVHLATTLRLYDRSIWPSIAPKPTVFVSISEHHSNLLPWRESVANVVTIPLDATGRQLDLVELERQVVAAKEAGSQLLIGSFSAGSNLTGIAIDTRPLSRIMHRYGGVAFFDYAGVGAYVDIDMNPADDETVTTADRGLAYKDAVFLSPHKFIGGPGTPGVLVARSALFRPDAPSRPGGGSVNFVTGSEHEYLHDLEEREEAGTPAIVEAIRCGLAFRVKQIMSVPEIERREHALAARTMRVMSEHPKIRVLGETQGMRVPVFCIQVLAPGDAEEGVAPTKFLHYNFVSSVLNDFFGVQTRGGCMCAGPFGISLLKLTPEQVETYQTLLSQDPSVRRRMVHGPAQPSPRATTTCPLVAAKLDSLKPGYLRFSFNYFTPATEVDAVLRAVTWVADHGWRLLPYYKVDPQSGAWSMRCAPTTMRSLAHKAFRGVRDTDLLKDPAEGAVPVGKPESDAKALHVAQRLADRVAAVVNAHGTAIQAELRDGYQAHGAAVEAARWFMHPAEAAAILDGTAAPEVAAWYPGKFVKLAAKSIRRSLSPMPSIDRGRSSSSAPRQDTAVAAAAVVAADSDSGLDEDNDESSSASGSLYYPLMIDDVAQPTVPGLPATKVAP